MAIDLSKLEAPRAGEAIICTIVGEEGIGKTSLAGSFPKPVFIRVEEGTKSLTSEEVKNYFSDVREMPVVHKYADVIEQLNALGEQKHDYKTVVIDTITQLNTMIESEIVAKDKALSINSALGGYGAGQSAVADRHAKIRETCGDLRTYKKMNIVFLAHADHEKIDPPDAESYMRYTVKLHNKSMVHYIDNVDLVAYIKLRTYVSEGKDKKRNIAMSDGNRIITCHKTANHVSKNRFGITEDIEFKLGVNPFLNYVRK
jgi:hypothetical protein